MFTVESLLKLRHTIRNQQCGILLPRILIHGNVCSHTAACAVEQVDQIKWKLSDCYLMSWVWHLVISASSFTSRSGLDFSVLKYSNIQNLSVCLGYISHKLLNALNDFHKTLHACLKQQAQPTRLLPYRLQLFLRLPPSPQNSEWEAKCEGLKLGKIAKIHLGY